MAPNRISLKSDYKNLQLSAGASLSSIKNSYKTLVKIWHPDLFPSDKPKAQEKAHKMFLLINDSYNRLVKYHEERSHNDYSRIYSDPPSYKYPRESTNWENEELSSTQTIEMVDQKWPDGTQYQGMTLSGKFHGRGIYTYPNGDVYAGEFRFGKIQGEGQFTFKNGDKYIGSVYENTMHGKGKMTFATGGHYIGYFSNNQFHGEGLLATPKKVCQGNWDRGIFID